jgi:hypothetical protein
MESALNIDVDDVLCRCPDALSLAATPFDKLCYRCGKEIDVYTWKHWQVIHPYSKDTNWFAFGLRRDDAEEFRRRHSSYFHKELSDICYMWKCLSVSEEEAKNIEFELLSDTWLQGREEFYSFQTKHIIGNHRTYEQYCEEQLSQYDT